MSLFKGSLAPTISLALFQWTAFAYYFTTLGYLIIIMVILAVGTMPRAKFLQTMLINVLFTCLGAAITLLALYCSVKARVNSVGYHGPGTGGPGTSGTPSNGAATATYNSSGSAVAGVWLFVQIYIISVIRGKKPQYTIPCILWAVFANVAMTYGPQFSTMAQAEAFTKQLLVAFLTGFGIAAVVSLLVFPLTSRQVVFKSMATYITSLQGAVRANLKYLHSLEDSDMFAAQRTNTAGEKPPRSKEAQEFKEKVQGLAALHAKLGADLPFAKREIAMGKLGPDDIQECYRQFRLVMVPTLSLSSLSDIFERVAEDRGWDRSVNLASTSLDEAPNDQEKIRIEAINEWHELMSKLREPFDMVSKTIDDGLQHVLLTLQLIKPAKKGSDVEANGNVPQPGEKAFTTYFESKYREFGESKKTMLRGWCHIHDIDLPEDFFENGDHADFDAPKWMQEGILSEPHRRLRRQLFLCLYIEFLLMTMSKRLHKLMITVDNFRDSGKLSKTRLVVPGYKRLRKWFLALFHDNEDAHGEGDIQTDGHNTQVHLGDAYKKKKDPEHLPPQNTWEHFGNQFRKIAHFFRSPASSFGFRVACATLSIGVISFLKDTQVFFTKERLFWAQIMVSISMSPTAGQGLRNVILRVLANFGALIAAWIAWYIVDGQTAGVIVFFFIVIHGGVYILLKYPQYTTVGLVSQVTVGLIIGYELQVRKVGVQIATSNGQEYYPIYELGPIRVATCCAGFFVAWVWTIFPYPISEHSQIRKNLASALYLLANYYSVTHETVRLRLRDELGDMSSKDSPGRKLEKSRNKIFSKANLTIQGLRAQSAFLKFDIPVGGQFPRKQYQDLVTQLQSILNFMSLVSVASYSFTELREEGTQDSLRWLHDFQRLVGEAHMTSEQVTTLLSLMSAAVSGGQALPPYLRVPEPWLLASKLDSVDKDILSIRHIAEPGYASFAVVQIGTKFIHDDLRKLVAGVKELVGELDFSYHIVSTTDPTREADETLVYTRTNTVDSRVKLD
ncbi:hypothetical protein M409DRAFT_69769 [Zasmidium cellare ATCC 36951]|uniref:ER transporter 6TM N-terminal domain-containing protein n=1 Tax=Zasmidium cellare ATCC 36951 TaxID=1080233 RepID=A0A6A6C2Y8_ZASCE|nr:uncharacterized protein M409DRAFT_69769 [Zasmidium cellare ATCC 36951]KAF2161411.1 hypothetical protein M409DRAFT_69769 [Zasmidium cellare ATCC 36951]